MNDKEFEQEVEQLNAVERKKQTESVEYARKAVIDAFNDHYYALSDFDGVFSVEDFLLGQASNEDELEADDMSDPLIGHLTELMDAELDRYPQLNSGRVLVRGGGVYMYNTPYAVDEHESFELDLLEDGDSIVGDVRSCMVAPMIAYESYLHSQYGDSHARSEDDSPPELPGLWLVLENATVESVSEAEIKKLDRVIVPLSYPSLRFEKADDEEYPIVSAPVQAYFTSEFMNETYCTMENTLNHNEYTTAEHRTLREAYQAELEMYLRAVQKDAELIIDARDVAIAFQDTVDLVQQRVQYNMSVIVQHKGVWRVVHAFDIDTPDGPLVGHVLTDKLDSITENTDE